MRSCFVSIASRCHAARLQSDVPESALPFEAWASAIFSAEGAIVWASADYQKTGVTPYVHESGTRVPSLRRAVAKWPHFTNGSADTLLDVVRRARFDRSAFLSRRRAVRRRTRILRVLHVGRGARRSRRS